MNRCSSCVFFMLILCILRSTTEFSFSGMAARDCGLKPLPPLSVHSKERVYSTADMEDRCEDTNNRTQMGCNFAAVQISEGY